MIYFSRLLNVNLRLWVKALKRLSKIDSTSILKIHDYKKIISFRNVLIHGYADIDNRLAWNMIESKLQPLIKEIESLLDE